MDRVEAKNKVRVSRIVHPKHLPDEWPIHSIRHAIHFFWNDLEQRMPVPDLERLASLERSEFPTIHNVIMDDRIVSKLRYDAGLFYATSYSLKQFKEMRAFPGVELVAPFADSRNFIQNADLVVSIQGTIGLEGALLGKPVIMLAESPVTLFPSASGIGAISDLPDLIRSKLAQQPPAREEIVDAYASFLEPFLPASYNDWKVRVTEEEIENYVRLFIALKRHVLERQTPARATRSQVD